MRRISGILFDLGDTLIDFGAIDATALFREGSRAAHAYLQEIGQPVAEFDPFHRRQLWSVRWHYFLSRLTGREFNALDLLRANAERAGQQLLDEQVMELAWLWYAPLKRRATVEPGVADALRRLAGEGLTLGVVSNTFVPSQVLDRHLAEEGLLAMLPVRVYSCDVGVRKPNPRIFRDALRRARLDSEEVLFVGDSPRADIDGANRMGMVSVLKDPAGRHRDGQARPDHRVRSVVELPELLAQYERA